MYLIDIGGYEWSDILNICDDMFLSWYDNVLDVYECLNDCNGIEKNRFMQSFFGH